MGLEASSSVAKVAAPRGRFTDRDGRARRGRLARAPMSRATRTPRRSAAGTVATLRRHWLIAAFLLVAVVLRIAVTIAYWPALELWADSYDYLHLAQALIPGNWHPSGYPLYLAAFAPTGQLGLVVVTQHLMGIAMGVLVYCLALRLGVRRWLAALAALPVLVDGYELDIEQLILAEPLAELLLLGGVTALLSREHVGARRGAVVGLLIAGAAITRTALMPILIVVALYLVLRGRRWRALLGFGAVAAAVLVAYGGWYAATYGSFGYSDYAGYWLYGRVAPFATCDYPLPPKEAALCPTDPLWHRTQSNEYFADAPSSPINVLHRLGTVRQRNVLGEQFGIDVIEHQPLAYAEAVLSDTWHYFTPGRWMTSDAIDMQRWIFPPLHINSAAAAFNLHYAGRGFSGRITASPQPALIPPLRAYQSWVYTPGPALLACLVAALIAGLGLVRRRAGRRHARWAALTLAATAVVVVLSPSVSTGFSYRYGLPMLLLLPPAGAAAVDIGLDALVRARSRGRSGPRSWLGGERPGTEMHPSPAPAEPSRWAKELRGDE